MRRAKLIHLATNLEMGGCNIVLKEMVAASAEHYDCEVWCLSPGGPLEEDVAALGVPIRVLGLGKHIWRRRTTRELTLALRQALPDILHCHSFRPNFHGCLSGQAIGIPHIIITQHDARIRTHHALVNWWLRRIPSAIVMSVSPPVAEEYIHRCRYSRERVRALPNPVDTDLFRPGSPGHSVAAELGIQGNSPVIGMVGGLARAKGHPHLLHAFVQVRQAFPDAALLLIGDGPQRARLEALTVELGQSDRVHFVGLRRDVHRLLPLLTTYAQSSLWESDGIAIKEAMACGVPVVATATTGARNILQDRELGLVCPIGDADALADALIRVCGDSDLASRLGQAGRERCVEHFSAEQYAVQLRELYETLLSSPTAAPVPE